VGQGEIGAEDRADADDVAGFGDADGAVQPVAVGHADGVHAALVGGHRQLTGADDSVTQRVRRPRSEMREFEHGDLPSASGRRFRRIEQVFE
jgi:hypothetical protein